jgi:2-phosphosulfolactate phosphatase
MHWGWRGAREAAARGHIVVIVDTLRFSSAVVSAVAHGALVTPAMFKSDAAPQRFNLSPQSYGDIEPDTAVTLPSPNGAQCCLNAAAAPHVIAASLLNATAAARYVAGLLDATTLDVAVIAAGERWRDPDDDGALRFALEDLLGAGAVLDALSAYPQSPEARAAAAVFHERRDDLTTALRTCGSGLELIAAGKTGDVDDCAHLDRYEVVPVLKDGVFASADESG